jgi:hypothetical protein
MNVFFKLNILIFTFLFSLCAFGIDDDYPKSKADKEMDSTDSVLGEGIVFTPSKIRNNSTKSNISVAVNKYIWNATIQILDFMPLNSCDMLSGIIITDWHTPHDKPNYAFKINIFINGDVISPESIDIRVFEKVLKNGIWITENKTSNLGKILESKILQKARTLYVSTSK